MAATVVSIDLNGQEITIETGRMARQAAGSVVIRSGDSMVLVTATAARSPRPDAGFFPLTCDYVEKYYAAGKFPGGFFKREARPGEKEVLTSRLIDRPIRPMFPDGYLCETQIIATVISMDRTHSTDVLAVTGASAALMISDIPFQGPMACVRVGRVGGRLIVNPTTQEQAQSDIDLVVAGTRDAIVMVEGGAKEVPEAEMIEALEFAHKWIQPLLDAQLDLQAKLGKAKREVVPPKKNEAVIAAVREHGAERARAALAIREKLDRYARLDDVGAELVTELTAKMQPAEPAAFANDVKAAYKELKTELMRLKILDEGLRIDGRTTTQIRPITCEVGVLPRVHGSALFTRGETQALVTVTLGTGDDVQRIDTAEAEYDKQFMLHYNFPPFSVGEVKFLRSPGRREIGHGNLAERSLATMLPQPGEDFPYTVRIVSEILESNGSSSMASVCGGSLALFDAGVKSRSSVAGIAMGLIMEGERYAVLSDILGDEDHLGDMDFKVCGTRRGITGFQMDIKISGLSTQIMAQALEQAREGRVHILEIMDAAIEKPRSQMSQHAPRFATLKIKVDRIRDVIGPGGKTIRSIVDKTGAKIEVEDSGLVRVASADQKALDMAVQMIRELTQEAEIGKLYLGQVKRVTDFGAFVEIFPGTDGLVHISHLAHERVNKVTDIVREGDEVLVRVIDVDNTGRIRLSRKEALEDGQR